MRIDFVSMLPRGILPAILVVGLLTAGASAVVADDMAAAPTPSAAAKDAKAPAAETAGKPLSTDARIVVVEWRIKKGREQEFLDYWSTKSTVPDRAGLIAEFMSGEESRQQFPWINWAAAEGGDFTTFYNIGIWRKADDFMGQIGKYIDNNRPPMAFEADHRHRVFLQPLRWRIGQANLPAQDAEGVK